MREKVKGWGLRALNWVNRRLVGILVGLVLVGFLAVRLGPHAANSVMARAFPPTATPTATPVPRPLNPTKFPLVFWGREFDGKPVLKQVKGNEINPLKGEEWAAKVFGVETIAVGRSGLHAFVRRGDSSDTLVIRDASGTELVTLTVHRIAGVAISHQGIVAFGAQRVKEDEFRVLLLYPGFDGGYQGSSPEAIPLIPGEGVMIFPSFSPDPEKPLLAFSGLVEDSWRLCLYDYLYGGEPECRETPTNALDSAWGPDNLIAYTAMGFSDPTKDFSWLEGEVRILDLNSGEDWRVADGQRPEWLLSGQEVTAEAVADLLPTPTPTPTATVPPATVTPTPTATPKPECPIGQNVPAGDTIYIPVEGKLVESTLRFHGDEVLTGLGGGGFCLTNTEPPGGCWWKVREISPSPVSTTVPNQRIWIQR